MSVQSHTIVAVGDAATDILAAVAVDDLREMGGGIALVRDSVVLEHLPSVAGLMSERIAEEIGCSMYPVLMLSR